MTELREKLNNIVEEKQTKIIPENLKVGVEVFGVHGTFTADADATAEDIALDKTAYVNGEKVVGTYDNKLKTDKPIEISDVVGNVQIKIDGKNKFDQDEWFTKLQNLSGGTGYASKIDIDGITYFKIRPANYSSNYQHMKGEFKENTQYALSFNGRQYDSTNTTTGFIIYYTDGTTDAMNVAGTYEEGRYVIISAYNKTIDHIGMSWGYGNYCLLRDIQLEEGTVATEYTKFKDGEIYTFDIEDGDKFEISLN